MEETILTKLHLEHQEIEHDLNLILRTVDAATKRELFRQVKNKLVQHMEGEDFSIYRHFKEDVKDGNKLKFILASDSEHHCIKEFLQRLTLMDIKSNMWDKTLVELIKVLRRHVSDEEDEIFSEAKEDFSNDELIDIGTEFEQVKSRSH